MKLRQGFISNSSSTSFMITNTSTKKKTIVDFVEENPQLIEQFVKKYDWNDDPSLTQEELIKSAKAANIKFKPKEKKECVFGDEQHTVIGRVFDYILRDGGKSKSFKWKFYKSLR